MNNREDLTSMGTNESPEVACIACGKVEPRRHPGHFLCGNPACREKVVRAVERMTALVHVLRDHVIALDRHTSSGSYLSTRKSVEYMQAAVKRFDEANHER